MPVTSNPSVSRFTLVRQVGTDGNGKAVFKNKSYGNVKWDATDQDVYDVGMALGNLSQFPAQEVIRYDNESLVNI
ncbi:MAG: DUF1659 domain-containing protein [Thermicanus sp.]|nr:DUF1659 domain-containing protein [Thermicanus sp.]